MNSTRIKSTFLAALVAGGLTAASSRADEAHPAPASPHPNEGVAAPAAERAFLNLANGKGTQPRPIGNAALPSAFGPSFADGPTSRRDDSSYALGIRIAF